MTFHKQHPGRRQDHRAAWSFDGFDGPIDDSNFGGRASRTTSGRSTGTRTTSWSPSSSARACASSAREMQKRADDPRDRPFRIRGPRKSSSRSRNEILAEKPRGATPRYWDDVQVGDEIDIITKGPLGLTDFIAFIAGGCGADPAGLRRIRCGAASATTSIRSGPSVTRGRMRSSRCTRCTTTTMRPSCRARRSPTTSASSAPAGRSTR